MTRRSGLSVMMAVTVLTMFLGACGSPESAQTSPPPAPAAVATETAPPDRGIRIELEPVPTVQVYRPTPGPVAAEPGFPRTRTLVPTVPAAPTDVPNPRTRFFEARRPTIVRARDLGELDEGVCALAGLASPENSGALLIQGNILGPAEVYVGGDVLIGRDGKILCVGADCSTHEAASGATRIVCPDGVVSPGLINAHDHILFDHYLPADWGDLRYDQRHDWRKGNRDYEKIDCDPTTEEVKCEGNSDPLLITWTELRQLMSGTTSLATSPDNSGMPGLVRNLDWPGQFDEGLEDERVDFMVFPLDDQEGDQIEIGCGYDSLIEVGTQEVQAVFDVFPFSIHIAEGVDQVAHNEFRCLSGQQRDGVDATGPTTSFVHAIALRPLDARILKDSSSSVIWSPRSNISLYGATAPVTLFANMGIWRIALSTDWTPSGSMNLLRELECAGYYNTHYLDGYFTDYELWKMVTVNAAVALNLEDQIGMLATGHFADITIFAGTGGTDYHQAVVRAGPEDVVLVLSGGVPLYGDKELMRELRAGESTCAEIPGGVCGQAKSVCVPYTTGITLEDLHAANAASLRLFYCGTPPGEPSCEPMRQADEWGCGQYPLEDSSQDVDRDGVVDQYDNCPTIFNPVLPLDGYRATVPEACRQADYDGDHVGDACDPDPMRP